MTNEELRKKRERLEIERNIQYLQNDLNYDNVDADMSLSIKDASDQELRKILRRLQMEADVQRMAMDIKRRSVGEDERMYLDSKISTEEPINSLYHYGIKGMRWGVKRGRNVSKKPSKKQTGRASDDYKTTRSLKKKGVRSLSNSELKKVNERLQLERQYGSLNPRQKSVGKRLAIALGNITVDAVTDSTKKRIGKQIDKRIGAKIDANIDKLLAKKG